MEKVHNFKLILYQILCFVTVHYVTNWRVSTHNTSSGVYFSSSLVLNTKDYQWVMVQKISSHHISKDSLRLLFTHIGPGYYKVWFSANPTLYPQLIAGMVTSDNKETLNRSQLHGRYVHYFLSTCVDPFIPKGTFSTHLITFPMLNHDLNEVLIHFLSLKVSYKNLKPSN